MLQQHKLDFREPWLNSERKIRNDIRIFLEIKHLHEIVGEQGEGNGGLL
jgi:hypothetical protein